MVFSPRAGGTARVSLHVMDILSHPHLAVYDKVQAATDLNR